MTSNSAGSLSKLAFLLLSFGTNVPCAFCFSISSTTLKDTKVNAAGKASVLVTPPPLALHHNVTLTHYMQLPVEQYVLIPMPSGSSLTRKEKPRGIDDLVDVESWSCDDGVDGVDGQSRAWSEEFELEVPTITFFNLSVQPVVHATVHPQKNQVVISSKKCLLRGSPFIDKVKLNDRFDFNVRTTLTWTDPLSPSQSRFLDDEKLMGCSISSETLIHVDVDVPRPFSSIPKVILEKTGNAAMKLSMKYIQGNFVNNLAKDYEKWSTDSEYRSFRASLSTKKDLSHDLFSHELKEATLQQ